jgi:hypothetical protein
MTLPRTGSQGHPVSALAIIRVCRKVGYERNARAIMPLQRCLPAPALLDSETEFACPAFRWPRRGEIRPLPTSGENGVLDAR